jgi:hypothetical protein
LFSYPGDNPSGKTTQFFEWGLQVDKKLTKIINRRFPVSKDRAQQKQQHSKGSSTTEAALQQRQQHRRDNSIAEIAVQHRQPHNRTTAAAAAQRQQYSRGSRGSSIAETAIQ